jgi:hypothetical protein
LAAVSLKRNPIRSTRVLYDYLRTTDTLDEAAFDNYTLALWEAQSTHARNGAFWQMVQYHEIYERRCASPAAATTSASGAGLAAVAGG